MNLPIPKVYHQLDTVEETPVLTLDEVIKKHILEVCIYYKGNYTKAAKVLGIHRNTITSLVGPAKEFKRKYHK